MSLPSVDSARVLSRLRSLAACRADSFDSLLSFVTYTLLSILPMNLSDYP